MKGMVSAIITTHNRIELLKEAVSSVLNQTYKSIELIIVDDNSSDDTQTWCKELQSSFQDRIKYIYIDADHSKGGNYARNLGIKNSKGEYIAFLDDDDRWLPDKIEKQVKLIEEKNCDFVYGGRIVEVIDSQSQPKYYKSLLNEEYQGDVSQKILTNIFTTTSLILVRKTVFDKVGLFDENLSYWQEYELSIRIAQFSKFYYVDSPVIYYRVDHFDNQRLTNKYYGWKRAVRYIHKKHQRLYEKLPINYKVASKALVWHDAAERCKASRLRTRYLYFNFLRNLYKIYLAIKQKTLFKKMYNKLTNFR